MRYIVIAGMAYLVVWKWKGRKLKKYFIQEEIPNSRHLWRDFRYSVSASFIFATIGFLISLASKSGYTLLYYDFSRYGPWYFAFTVVIILLVHDTFFYWAHRFMHLPGVYRHVHLVHHQSTNPSPWSAFAFHPFETVLEAMILPIIVFFVPVHLYAIVVFLIIMTLMNVIGHMGYELYPAGFLRNPVGRWNNTSTHHNMHHHYVHWNYGLYFNWWDTWMKTNHPHYFETFESIKNRRP